MAKRKEPAHAPKQSNPTTATVTNPDRWDLTQGTFISGRAFIDGAESLGADMDKRWGIDRLRLLVPPEIREKFDRQRYKLQAAIENGTLEEVRTESARMIAGYLACDKIASENGERHIEGDMIEIALDDGTVVTIVPDIARAAMALTAGRQATILTYPELSLILSHHKATMEVKKQWPGAKVTAVRAPTDPLRKIYRPTGLDEPFNDPIPFPPKKAPAG